MKVAKEEHPRPFCLSVCKRWMYGSLHTSVFEAETVMEHSSR
jgi:hypothetical protein